MAGIRLREWRAADARAITPMLEDPELVRWSRLTEVGVERWIAEQREGRRGPSMAVCRPDDDEVLGKVALRLPGRASPATTCDAVGPGDRPAGELSYWVLPDARGRGVATAAALAMLERAPGFGGMRSVVLDIETDNLASMRVAERIGAIRRDPTRVEYDRHGVPRTLVVFVVRL